MLFILLPPIESEFKKLHHEESQPPCLASHVLGLMELNSNGDERKTMKYTYRMRVLCHLGILSTLVSVTSLVNGALHNNLGKRAGPGITI